jgi:hypothetical protein
LRSLADRIASTAPLIHAHKAHEYLDRFIRPRLHKAANEDRLAIGAHAISKHVRVVQPSVLDRHAFDLVGGRRNFKRKPELVDLPTPDGGWIFFAAVLQPTNQGLEVVGYNIERFFGQDHRPAWIRFDYNEAGHENDHRGLRSHFHPGNDDIQLPAPIFAPHELIDFLLGGLGPREGRRARHA